MAYDDDKKTPSGDVIGSPEWYARRAWTLISLGNIAKPANSDAVVKAMAPFFREAMDASAEERERLLKELHPWALEEDEEDV